MTPMMGTKAHIFAPIAVMSLEELVPRTHFYRHLDQVLDLSFVRNLVKVLKTVYMRLFQLFGEANVEYAGISPKIQPILPRKCFPKERMPISPLFPLPDGLEITSVSETSAEVLVRVTLLRQTSCCPMCSTPSSAIHSYYRRHPLDLPCVGRFIRLLLTVKKFFCRQPSCQRKIFTERLPDLLEISSRLHETATQAARSRRLDWLPVAKGASA